MLYEWLKNKPAILSWFVPSDIKNAAICDGVLISDIDRGLANISSAVLEDDVDVSHVERYFTREEWRKVESVVSSMRKRNKYFCAVCRKDLKTTESILCNVCMEWNHFDCVALKRNPKSVYWFCLQCKNKHLS